MAFLPLIRFDEGKDRIESTGPFILNSLSYVRIDRREEERGETPDRIQDKSLYSYPLKLSLERSLEFLPCPLTGSRSDALTRFQRGQRGPGRGGVPHPLMGFPTTRPQQCCSGGSKHQLPLSLGANERSSFCSWGEARRG